MDYFLLERDTVWSGPMNMSEGPTALYEFIYLEESSQTQQASSPHAVNNVCTALSATAVTFWPALPLKALRSFANACNYFATNAACARSHTQIILILTEQNVQNLATPRTCYIRGTTELVNTSAHTPTKMST
jgi:hypothetical protein